MAAARPEALEVSANSTERESRAGFAFRQSLNEARAAIQRRRGDGRIARNLDAACTMARRFSIELRGLFSSS
jgi:hypothetical protein